MCAEPHRDRALLCLVSPGRFVVQNLSPSTWPTSRRPRKECVWRSAEASPIRKGRGRSLLSSEARRTACEGREKLAAGHLHHRGSIVPLGDKRGQSWELAAD